MLAPSFLFSVDYSLADHLEGGLEGSGVHPSGVPVPQGIDTVIRIVATLMGEVIGHGIEHAPRRTRDPRHGVTGTLFEEADDLTGEPLRGLVGLGLHDSPTLDDLGAEDTLDILLDVLAADPVAGKLPVLLHGGVELATDDIHGLTDHLEGVVRLARVSDAEQLARRIPVGRSQGVGTYYTNVRGTGTDRHGPIVAVAQENVGLHLIPRDDLTRQPLNSGEDPNPLAPTEGTGGLQGRLSGVQEGLEPLERGCVLEWLVCRADDAEHRLVRVSDRGVTRHGHVLPVVLHVERLKPHVPVQARRLDGRGHVEKGVLGEHLAELVPRWLPDKECVGVTVGVDFDFVGHDDLLVAHYTRGSS